MIFFLISNRGGKNKLCNKKMSFKMFPILIFSIVQKHKKQQFEQKPDIIFLSNQLWISIERIFGAKLNDPLLCIYSKFIVGPKNKQGGPKTESQTLIYKKNSEYESYLIILIRHDFIIDSTLYRLQLWMTNYTTHYRAHLMQPCCD